MLRFNDNINFISRQTSHYVTKKTLRNKLNTYMYTINDEAEIVKKLIKMPVMTKIAVNIVNKSTSFF